MTTTTNTHRQFPDPHFKKQHKKRRVVTPELVETLALHCKGTATVFIQSDVERAQEQMYEEFDESPHWALVRGGRLSFPDKNSTAAATATVRDADATGATDGTDEYNNSEENKNPYPFPTERELSVISYPKNGRVYRALFERREKEG